MVCMKMGSGVWMYVMLGLGTSQRQWQQHVGWRQRRLYSTLIEVLFHDATCGFPIFVNVGLWYLRKVVSWWWRSVWVLLPQWYSLWGGEGHQRFEKSISDRERRYEMNMIHIELELMDIQQWSLSYSHTTGYVAQADMLKNQELVVTHSSVI